MHYDLAALARDAAARWTDAPALLFDATGEELSFSEFDRRSDAIASALCASGIKPGDRVVVCSANIALFPLAWFGIVKAGAIMVPLNTGYRFDDARHLLALAEPRAAFCDGERAALLAALQNVTPSLSLIVCSDTDVRPGWQHLPAFEKSAPSRAPSRQPIARPRQAITNIQFTSGTSGLPKGCMLTHRYWFELTAAVNRAVVALSPDDAMLTAQAFSYLDPQWAFVLTLRTGARLIVLERFRPSLLWDKINQYDVSFFYCLAAMPLMLLSRPPGPAERTHRLRAIMCSAIPADRHQELEERFGTPWLEAYGTTETGADIAVSWEDHDRLVGVPTLGKPMAHREVRIVDDRGESVEPGAMGELLLRGPGIMWGYWRNAEATAAAFLDGWYRTGDLVRQDDAGCLYIVGRRKDMIRRAGENIAAAEVEATLQQHPDVLLAACVAVADEIRGEEIKVFVVRSKPVEAKELADFLESRVAKFKIPRYWEFPDALPMTPSERVAKPLLSREIGAGVWDRAADSGNVRATGSIEVKARD